MRIPIRISLTQSKSQKGDRKKEVIVFRRFYKPWFNEHCTLWCCACPKRFVPHLTYFFSAFCQSEIQNFLRNSDPIWTRANNPELKLKRADYGVVNVHGEGTHAEIQNQLPST